MKGNKLFRVFGVLMIFALLVSTVTLPAKAQDAADGGTAIETNVATVDAPTQEVFTSSANLPELTEQQIAQLQWGENNTHLAPSQASIETVDIAGPTAGTETVVSDNRQMSGQPLAPGDPSIYRNNEFGAVIPAGFKSNVMESSTAARAKQFFYTGNWFSAWSKTKGSTWNYLSAFTGYPDFCCDQVVVHDDARDIYIWLRMAVPNAAGQNTFKLSIAYADPFSPVAPAWTYTFAPTGTNPGWTNQWWDYPHMQLGADYLYIAWNLFNAAGAWTRTVMLRFPLDSLAAAAGFSYNYLDQNAYFTFVPVSGASHYMYFASNWGANNTTLRIWRWDEDSAGLVFWDRVVPAWNTAYPVCGAPNWLGRADMRLLTGAMFKYNEEGIGGEPKTYGREVLGWWWNVAAGGGFTQPYIEGAAFYADTMSLVGGFTGRPYVYGSWCFAYPSMAPNARRDLGAVFNYADPALGLQKPGVLYSLADDYFHAPPGWPVYTARNSNAGPSDNKWGDYNTTRNFQLGTTWIAGVHFIPGAANCSTCAVPVLLVFGRVRDARNFWNSQ